MLSDSLALVIGLFSIIVWFCFNSF
jgi:hypothetical protein